MWVLLALVALETAAAAALPVLLVVELLVAPASSLGTALALVALAVILVGVLVAVLVGMWRGRAWSRAAGVVIQVLIFAVGVGALQGAFAQPTWGWPLIAVGVVGFALLVSQPVAGWFRAGDPDDHDRAG